MSRPCARLMAASILSFGMFTLFAFWRTRRSAGLLSGSGPPAFTAMTMSFPMRANCFAMRSHRANMVALRTSKMRPIGGVCLGRPGFSGSGLGNGKTGGAEGTEPSRARSTRASSRTGSASGSEAEPHEHHARHDGAQEGEHDPAASAEVAGRARPPRVAVPHPRLQTPARRGAVHHGGDREDDGRRERPAIRGPEEGGERAH